MGLKKFPASLLCDFYKVGHIHQYPKDTQYVFSTWTPRTSRLSFVSEVMAFGFQGFIKEYLIDYFNENFFSKSEDAVAAEYERYLKFALLIENPDSTHIRALHKLGYLPLSISALPEGTMVPIRVPMLTVVNTHPNFGWLTNYIETIASCVLWQPSTSATIARSYRTMLNKFAEETSGSPDFVQWQGHDFSMRGMGGLDAACTSGAGHLLSFTGTDTIPAIGYLEKYYNADIEKELVGASVFATEHSVMCAGGAGDEYQTYLRLISEVYPSGIVSIVSDTWDLWHVVTDTLPKLKDKIMARDGKVVIRPDSGDPADIICGTDSKIRKFDSTSDAWHDFMCDDSIDGKVVCVDGNYYEFNGVMDLIKEYGSEQWYGSSKSMRDLITGGRLGVLYPRKHDPTSPASKGLIELLWDTFGGTVNSKGYKELDPHIGAIYGDSITYDRAMDICSRLKAKGFASTNIVLGIGSYTYQYNTRDTFGFAMKSTHCIIGGEERNIFKDPATDTDKIKKSQTGRVVVLKTPKGLAYVDELSVAGEASYTTNQLKCIFKDGHLLVGDSLSAIRARAAA